jgi:hypothetical protein
MPSEPTTPSTDEKSKMMSRTALALGAAGLFLFIVGIKRKHRLDNEIQIGDRGPGTRAGGEG